MKLKKGWVRLASGSLLAVALAMPGTPVAPRPAAAAAGASAFGEAEVRTPAGSAEDCDFLLRFGRAWWDGPMTQMVPVQMRLTCEGPLASMQLTVNGRTLPADIRVRGGDALLTTAVALTAGQPGGNLCLTATLLGSSAEEITHCTSMPDPPQPAARPAMRAEPPAAAATPAAPAADAPVPEGRAAAAPAPAQPDTAMKEPDGQPRAAAEAAAPGRPPVKRSGPDTSLKLPKGHTWGLDETPQYADAVDNAITRALRTAATQASGWGTANARAGGPPASGGFGGPAPSEPFPGASTPQRLPSLPGIQVLEAAGGPLDPNAPDPPRSPRRAAPDAVTPEPPRRGASAAPEKPAVAGPQAQREGAAGRAHPSHIVEPPAVAAEGRPVESRLDRAITEQRNEPDVVIRRSVRPAPPPARPKALVKAGDGGAASAFAGLAAMGLAFSAAGMALRRATRTQHTA